MNIPYKVGLEEAIAKLSPEKNNRFTTVMQHGTLLVEYYAPLIKDYQTPHSRDELYIIASGKSSFNRDGITVYCKAGDALFVPAGMEHKFENFSDDFATWVIFYGPEGGEKIRK